DGIVVVLTKQPGTDTVALTERIDAKFDSFRASLPPDIEIDTGLFRQAEFIDRAIENVLVAVRDGAILVVIVLFLFLMNLRTTGITLLAIPMSIAIASLVFAAFGLTINTMTLGGLAVAIGTLVDDAIVDVENVYRRLRERPGLKGRALLDLVLDASKEIRRPVVYGTMLVSVTYLPLFFLSGMEGRLLAPVGLAFLVSVAASLVVAMTLTPVLCSFWLGGAFAEAGQYGSRAARMIQDHVDGVVRFGIRHATAIAAAVAVLTLAAIVVLANRGATFLPPFQEGSAQVNLMLPPDVSLATSEAFGHRLEVAVGKVDGVASVARRTGRAPDDEHIMPLSVSEAIVRFDPDNPRSRDEILDDVRAALDREFPGVARSTEQPLAHLLSHLLSGVNAQVAIKIHGDDLAMLRAFASRVEHEIEDIDGVRDLYTEPLALVDHCEVFPRRDDLAEFGIPTSTLARSLELALGGEAISRLQSDKIAWPIVVRLPEDQRGDPNDIASIRLRTPEGAAIRVADVADVRLVPGPSEIRRENGQRRIVVQHNVSGRALGDVVADVEARIADVRAEIESVPGYGVTISGTFEAQQRATRTIAWLSIGAVFAMILILHRHFGSIRLALLILATRPIAFLGAVAAVLVTGQDLSVATLVGLIALLGVAVRNAILYVDYAAAIAGGGAFTADVLRRAARARVVPVLMTALTSGIGVLPLAMSGDEPGREILYPVATVILGGLVTNTLLDFLVTPGLLEGRTAGASE
ncbi:MAG: efflux RND transporter permease subunit, partial [Planctomycetes bacterium]|nr:efflux RND transporter permease subunit [Planctomycetota bacterium]